MDQSLLGHAAHAGPAAHRDRPSAARARRADRARPRHQDHRRRGERSRPAARHRRDDHRAQGLHGRRRSACSRSPPSATRPASCSACRSTWTAREGPRAQSTRAFARNFAKLTALPIGLWDERLSTAAVERDLIAADVSRAQARRGDRPARRDLHPARRARPARAAARRAGLSRHARRPRRAVSGLPADRRRASLLRRLLIAEDAHWVGTERILYYVMFPALLIGTLMRADLTKVPVLAVGGTLFARVLVMVALCFALRPLLARKLAHGRPGLHLAVPGRDALAHLRGASPWPATCSAISASPRLGRPGGDDAAAQCRCMCWVLLRYASPGRPDWRACCSRSCRTR